jgi:hypothetical protein
LGTKTHKKVNKKILRRPRGKHERPSHLTAGRGENAKIGTQRDGSRLHILGEAAKTSSGSANAKRERRSPPVRPDTLTCPKSGASGRVVVRAPRASLSAAGAVAPVGSAGGPGAGVGPAAGRNVRSTKKACPSLARQQKSDRGRRRRATYFGLLGGRRPVGVGGGVVAGRGAVLPAAAGLVGAAAGLIRGFGLVSLRLGKRRHLDAWLCGFRPDSLAARVLEHGHCAPTPPGHCCVLYSSYKTLNVYAWTNKLRRF